MEGGGEKEREEVGGKGKRKRVKEGRRKAGIESVSLVWRGGGRGGGSRQPFNHPNAA